MRKHRRSATKLLLATIVLTAGMSITSWAMTAEEVTAKNPTSYTAGTQSVYGPSLDQGQLSAVAQATADFMTNNITDSMDTDQKIKAAYDYIKNRTTYVNWDAVTGANTAYTLVTGQGACSGMCRSMKALCDAMGIECYHVHSTSNDHQWNLVRYGDGVLYHVDIDANKSAGQDVIYKSLTHPLPFDTTAYPAVGTQVQDQKQNATPQPTDGQHIMRASQSNNAVIMLNDDELPSYQREVRSGIECIVMDNKAITFSFPSNYNNLDTNGHEIWIYGAVVNNGIPTVIGEPIRYQFEYDKKYSLDFTGTNKDANALSQYCQTNNMIIDINIVDTQVNAIENPTGHNSIEFTCGYATSSSIKK